MQLTLAWSFCVGTFVAAAFRVMLALCRLTRGGGGVLRRAFWTACSALLVPRSG